MNAIINLIIAFSLVNSPNASMPQRGICAHRGAMDTHPENTVAAFREAVRLGVHMIEFDVRMTKDGKLVILHDETVDRTTNGHGAVKDKTLDEIKQLDAGSWKSTIFKNERIPTLREALAVMPLNIWLNVHLKGDGKLGAAVAKILYEEARLEQAFLACGKEAAEGAKSVKKEIMICNMERQADNNDYVDLTIQLKSEFIQLYKTAVNSHIEDITAKLKQKGIKINYCCTDDEEEIGKLFGYGVDFILVNHTKAAMKTARSVGINRVY